MHTDKNVIECKTVLKGKKQITIKGDDLKLLSYHAALQDRGPVMHIRLEDTVQKDWVLHPESDECVEQQ